MRHPFPILEHEYDSWVAAARIRPEWQRTVDNVCDRLVRFIDAGHYDEGCAATKVPVAWAAASFERESSSNFLCSPAQGDRWDRVSTHVPRGLGPYKSFTEAQIAAYKIDRLDQIAPYEWTWAYALYAGEEFNGFGYRDFHAIPTPYDVGATTIQRPGKYTSDGHFANVEDTQIGILPIMMGIVARRPALALAGAQPVLAMTSPAIILPIAKVAPSPIVASGTDVKWVQTSLNKILKIDPPLAVDGSYGRFTRNAVRTYEIARHLDVDAGIAGPQVRAAIEHELAA